MAGSWTFEFSGTVGDDLFSVGPYCTDKYVHLKKMSLMVSPVALPGTSPSFMITFREGSLSIPELPAAC